MTGFPKFWARVAKFGDLSPDITPHVLRHSFASIASDLGYSEATIASLVGQRDVRSHLATCTAPTLYCSRLPT